MDIQTHPILQVPLHQDSGPVMNQNETAALSVLGIPFHPLNMVGSLDHIDRFIRERKPRQICLANAYTVAIARHNRDLTDALKKSDLVLADGMSIVWGSRWLSINIPCRVAGPDLMEGVCARSAEQGYRVFLMGSSWENLEQLKKMLLKRWPRLHIVGLHSPSMCERFDETETQSILDKIHQAAPDILFVGVSAPKQEIWIAENLYRLQVPVNIGVGAAFDFLSGRIPRAPRKLLTF